MYLSYYKLNKKPFQISTDPKFLWLGKKHQQALSILKYGIEDDKGFLLLTGDVGTGKTTLLNAFVNSLEEDVIVARISDPGLTKLDFINHVAEKFSMETKFETKSQFLTLLTAFLEQAEQNNKKVLLIIDEAQHLTDEILEEIRLLSNIENQDKKLLNIFLIGQNEFNATLEKYQNRALRQRISINYTLYPLDPEETKTCIEYRLGVAGCQKEIFTPEAIDVIHTLSEGFPRVINIICAHALFHGCQEKQEKISDEMVWEISKDLRFAHIPQTLQEAEFSDPTDDDWLEASEVPPLSIEEINRASQPLPIIAPEIVEDQGRKSHKYRVAVPVFIMAFLLSGYFVLDESKIDSITQFFSERFRKTITSPLDKKTTEQLSSQVISKGSEAIQSPKEPTVTNSSAEAPPTITYLNNQKKSLPKTPEPTTSLNQLEDISSEHADNTDPAKKNRIQVPSIQEFDKHSGVAKDPPRIKQDKPIAAASQSPGGMDSSRSIENGTVNETIVTEIESTISDSPQTDIITGEEEPPLPSPAETTVQNKNASRNQNEVSLTGPTQQNSLGAGPTPDTADTAPIEVTQQQDPPVTGAEAMPQEGEITPSKKTPPASAEPTKEEDPGAVIDWLLESNKK